MTEWLATTLRSDPELLIILSLTWGFAASQVAGFKLGNVAVALLAAVVLGKLGIIVGQYQVCIPHVVPVRHRLRHRLAEKSVRSTMRGAVEENVNQAKHFRDALQEK